MTDGQLLVLVDGLTYTTYMQESAESYRVVGKLPFNIPQRKLPSASSSGSLGFIVCACSVVGWLIMYQLL